MARKPLLKYKNVNAVSMGADITSVATNIEFQDNIGVQFIFTGTPTGTFQIQISADHAEDSQGVVTTAGNWVDIVLDPIPTAAGAPDVIYVDITQISAPWIRVHYTRTSGTGTLTSYITAKSLA